METEQKKVEKQEMAPKKVLRRVYLDIDFEMSGETGDLTPWYQVGRNGVVNMEFVESEYGEMVLEVETQPTKQNWRGDSDTQVWTRNFIQIPVISILHMTYVEYGNRSACCGKYLGDRK